MPPPRRVELIAGGADIDVTEANKVDFVRKVCEWRLYGCIAPQVAALRRGLEAAVPREILNQLSALIHPDDLARMLAGEPSIDVADWEEHSVATGGLKRTSKGSGSIPIWNLL